VKRDDQNHQKSYDQNLYDKASVRLKRLRIRQILCSQQIPDVLRCRFLVEMLGGVAERVEQWLSFDGGLCLEEFHAAFDVDVGRTNKGAIGMHVVVEDHQSDHHPQHQEMRLLSLDL
jgi:hypothetical protein